MLLLVALAADPAHAEPMDFSLPSQSASAALLAFSNQSQIEVLFPSDALQPVRSQAVQGRFEPDQALALLLKGTGFEPRRSGPRRYIIVRSSRRTGTVRGRIVSPQGLGLEGVRVLLPELRLTAVTDTQGDYVFPEVRPGAYRVLASAPGYVPAVIAEAKAEANEVCQLPVSTLDLHTAPALLDPFFVRGKSAGGFPFDRELKLLPVRSAVGNLDLRRTEDDALPFTVYDRAQVTRSGVVNLNEFLQRELLDTDAATRPPEQNGTLESFVSTSANLSLRGYGSEETVVLVNGRRMPEVLTSGSTPLLPDVNFIPLSLVQQIEVLPVSASALYTGNAVGGVINIVLRPDVDAAATEVTGTYTNAVDNYDASQSSVSLLHAESLLNGRLRLRLNATHTSSTPPTEEELGYHQKNYVPLSPVGAPLYRATPNIIGYGLDMNSVAFVTSVRPGSDGTGGLAAFEGREGVANVDLFRAPGSFAASLDTLQYPYGRRQERSTFFGSVVYDLLPSLELGIDATYSRTVAQRGYDVLRGDLVLTADSPHNPFGRPVLVSLNEIARDLGESYSQARLDFTSVVLGALLKLPNDWRVAGDLQYAHNTTRYRGLAGSDRGRWQQLVNDGLYNPFRDTQVYGPPDAFYESVLVYRGRPGEFVTLGDYQTLDAAFRLTHESLPLPTGTGVLNLGGDYRVNEMADAIDERRFQDGSLAAEPLRWRGRVLQRYSGFGEVQAPLLPQKWLPGWLRDVDGDFAVRYVAADTSRESNVAPTFGLKIDFAGGFSFRGSATTSSRFPTPWMSRRVASPASNIVGVNYAAVHDPARGSEWNTSVLVNDLPNPYLSPESAVTQTAGLIFQRGQRHRFRLSLDFIDTRKTNELLVLDAQTVVNLENLWPERVTRAPARPNEPYAVGPLQTVLTGITNLAWRHSQNWNGAAYYRWDGCAGGALDLYARVVAVQRYDVQGQPTSSPVDELREPDGAAPNLLKYRSNFGLSWSRGDFGLGLDGHYFHSRTLKEQERALQGADRIDAFWQFDAYVHSNLSRWLPWKSKRYALTGQLRVNNVFASPYPKYAADSSASGVQAYGDWRGPIYSVSLTASF